MMTKKTFAIPILFAALPLALCCLPTGTTPQQSPGSGTTQTTNCSYTQNTDGTIASTGASTKAGCPTGTSANKGETCTLQNGQTVKFVAQSGFCSGGAGQIQFTTSSGAQSAATSSNDVTLSCNNGQLDATYDDGSTGNKVYKGITDIACV